MLHHASLRRTGFLCLLACALIAAPAVTRGASPVAKELSLRPAPARVSRSVGYAWDGRLVRGLLVQESKYLRYLPESAPAGRFYGTWQLVQLLQRAARRVWSRAPGARLTIGELSGKEGGDIGGHRSHESGRDADVSFYMMQRDHRPHDGFAFSEFDAFGRGLAPHGDLRFDVARNWQLVAKLVDDSDARVQYIFVAHSIRQLLLSEAVRRKADPSVIARAASVLIEPAHGNPHRSHFHVRIYCPLSDRPACVDVAPFWSWYPGTRPEPRAQVSNPSPLDNPPVPAPAFVDR
jgi:penicillin-insensitive murein endopeptidase